MTRVCRVCAPKSALFAPNARHHLEVDHLIPPIRGYGTPHASDNQVEPRLIVFYSEGRVVSGKLTFNDASVISPPFGVISKNHYAVATRRTPDDEVVDIFIQAPLPSA